jgi:hypothetical protein
VRKNGTIVSLFINRKYVIPINEWLVAETEHHTKGYKYRPYWHCCSEPVAPHLGIKNRCWYKVEIQDYIKFDRPINQGGTWYLSKKMKVLYPMIVEYVNK